MSLELKKRNESGLQTKVIADTYRFIWCSGQGAGQPAILDIARNGLEAQECLLDVGERKFRLMLDEQRYTPGAQLGENPHVGHCR